MASVSEYNGKLLPRGDKWSEGPDREESSQECVRVRVSIFKCGLVGYEVIRSGTSLIVEPRFTVYKKLCPPQLLQR